ncbi:MAG: hypothetical protein ACKESB_03310 [Candidatus Hodgkinia cicadicola]
MHSCEAVAGWLNGLISMCWACCVHKASAGGGGSSVGYVRYKRLKALIWAVMTSAATLVSWRGVQSSVKAG